MNFCPVADQKQSEATGVQAAGESDIEDRVVQWLDCRGIYPDRPSEKKHRYYDRVKKSITLSTKSHLDLSLSRSPFASQSKPRHKTSIHSSCMDLDDGFRLQEISSSRLILKRSTRFTQLSLDLKDDTLPGLAEDRQEPRLSKHQSMEKQHQ